MPDKLTAHANWLLTTPIAHRGLHDSARPENSLEAFEAAARAGYAIELDLRLTLDHVLVVMHDASTWRMTGVDRAIRATAFDQLGNLKLAKTAAHVPSFRQVLDVVGGRVPLLLEIKYPAKPRVICRQVLRELQDYQGDYAIEAFDPQVLIWLRVHAPEIVRGQNASTIPEYTHYPRWFRRLLCSMPLNWLSRPDFIAFDQRNLPSRALAFWQRVRPKPLLLWTVRTDEEAAVARTYKANIIFETIRPKTRHNE